MAAIASPVGCERKDSSFVFQTSGRRCMTSTIQPETPDEGSMEDRSRHHRNSGRSVDWLVAHSVSCVGSYGTRSAMRSMKNRFVEASTKTRFKSPILMLVLLGHA